MKAFTVGIELVMALALLVIAATIFYAWGQAQFGIKQWKEVGSCTDTISKNIKEGDSCETEGSTVCSDGKSFECKKLISGQTSISPVNAKAECTISSDCSGNSAGSRCINFIRGKAPFCGCITTKEDCKGGTCDANTNKCK